MIDVVRSIGSLKLTLVGMLLLGAAVLRAQGGGDASGWVVGPLALLCLNLLAALATNPRFRRQPALLAFHVCLLLVVLLAAAGRLSHFDGRVEIAEEQAFDPGAIEVLAQGPLHRLELPAGSFEQGRISVRYAPGVVRDGTRSQIWLASPGPRQVGAEVGDDKPLVVDGYRFYTTSNKGWAVQLAWQGEAGESLRGMVHLPSYPFLVRKQRNRWQPPAGPPLELALELDDVRQDESWVLESAGRRATLVLSVGERVERLEPGQSVRLEHGWLRFEALRMWMGYRVHFDPTLPWLAAAAVAGVGFMAWHFWLVSWTPALRPDPGRRAAAEA